MQILLYFEDVIKKQYKKEAVYQQPRLPDLQMRVYKS